MDISPIKKSVSFPGNREIVGFSGNSKKKARKSLLRGKKKEFSNKPGRSERKNSLTIVSIESMDDNKNLGKKKSKDIEKLCKKAIVPISEDTFNMFSSEILYDFSSEVFFQAKKYFQEKDALLKKTIEIANEDHLEFLKDFPEIHQEDTCLTKDTDKKTFIISSSINSYINEMQSPLKDLRISKKTYELFFSKEKVSSLVKNRGFFAMTSLFFFPKKFSPGVHLSSKKENKLNGLTHRVTSCFAHSLNLHLVKDVRLS